MKKSTIIILLMALATTAKAEMRSDYLLTPVDNVVLADTTRNGEDDSYDEEGEDGQGKEPPSRQNTAKGFNAMDYVMEHRHIPDHEPLPKRWYDHLYLQGAVGVERIMPPTDNYKLEAINTFSIAAAKQFSALHAVRAMFTYGTGYEQKKDMRFNKYGFKIDYLYGLLSSFDGFRPTRLIDVNGVIGAGLQSSKMRSKSAMSWEGHVGLQFRFFTGPKAYVAVEPYAGLGGDQMDLSDNRNWKGTDIFYGAHVSYIYYLSDNLSFKSRKELIDNRSANNELSADSVLASWQQPWFGQVGIGMSFMNAPNIGFFETMGNEMSIAAGKWLSPVIGLRLGVASRTGVWGKRYTAADNKNFHPAYVENLHNYYTSARLDALFNPLGFGYNYDWNRKWGGFLFAGIEYGKLHKTQSEELKCYTQSYGGGINAWWQPTEGLKVFVEPRFAHTIYNIPYSNVDWEHQFSDNNFTLSVGLMMETRDTKRWFHEPKYFEMYVSDPVRRFRVGLGGGTYIAQPVLSVEGGSRIGFNGLVFLEYALNRNYSARLGAEFVGMRQSNLSDYIDYNMTVPEADNAPVLRHGLWDLKYNLVMVSPGIQANLNQLLYGYQSRPLKLNAFAGPTVVVKLKPSSQLNKQERIMENHRVELQEPQKTKLYFGAHFGLKLDYRINSHLGAFFSPTFYWPGATKLEGLNLSKNNCFVTLSIGAQYAFDL